MLSWLTRALCRLEPSVGMAERRLLFLSGRTPLNDEAFLEQLPCRDRRERQWALYLRRLLAMFCSIHPEMIYPSDRTDYLEWIMDWGKALCGSWLECVDYGEWNGWECAGYITRDIRIQCPEFRGDFDKVEGKQDLPPFGSLYNHVTERSIRRVADWIIDSARVLIEVVPSSCQDRIPEYPEGTEEFFSKPAPREMT